MTNIGVWSNPKKIKILFGISRCGGMVPSKKLAPDTHTHTHDMQNEVHKEKSVETRVVTLDFSREDDT